MMASTQTREAVADIRRLAREAAGLQRRPQLTREEVVRWDRAAGNALRRLTGEDAREVLELGHLAQMHLHASRAADPAAFELYLTRGAEILRNAAARTQPARRRLPLSARSTVFIVHGRDDFTKKMVAEFVESLGARPVILHEQPNQGMTILEKFLAHADVAFAVALFTADDIGTYRGDFPSLRQRARQNVVFEFGFFLGALGRERTCALVAPGVEIPSDYSGVVFIEIDPHGAWRKQFARELASAGVVMRPGALSA